MLPKRGLAALAITTVALVLLLNFKTPDQTPPGRTGTVAVVEPGARSTAAPRASAIPRATKAPGAAPTPAPTAATGDASAAGTIQGPVVSTRWGPVQVEIVVADGRLQDVVALQLPSGRQSSQISAWSEPILRQEALQAGSATIDIVSGATYTSQGYARSLQAALDKAGLS
jgi:uncharacterized protein with FMN-binding domain